MSSSSANLLNVKPKLILSLSSSFLPADMYCQKCWRRIQHIAKRFWLRWSKESQWTLRKRKTCKTEEQTLIYMYINLYICIYMYGTLWVEKLKFGSEDNASARTDLSKKLDEGDSQKKS